MQSDIVSGETSGGTNTSHTIIVPSLQLLLSKRPSSATMADYEAAIVDDNALAKGTVASRKRTFRYLRELYLLRPDAILFRALRDLWNDDPKGQPLLAGLCALARDPVFRASSERVLSTGVGDELASSNLAIAVEDSFPGSYSDSTLAKIGRNTYSSWEQTGHLSPVGRSQKVRRRPVCTPSTTAYALLLGHLEGERGAALFDTFWVSILGQPRSHLIELATVASRRMLTDFRNSGGVIDVGFSELLRPMEGQLL